MSDAPLKERHYNQREHCQDGVEFPTQRITQYLLSLDQLQPQHADGSVRVAAEREGNTRGDEGPSVLLRALVPHPDPAATSSHQQHLVFRHQSPIIPHLHRPHRLTAGEVTGKERRRLFDSTLSQCDVESVSSEWSTTSGTTFDTRDEAAFRDGLTALDASIARLQKTMKLDWTR